jgi:ADP-ribosylglycohydrolase
VTSVNPSHSACAIRMRSKESRCLQPSSGCCALAIHNAGESSRTTHGAPSAVDACRYFAGLLLGALLGRSKEEILSPFCSPAQSKIIGSVMLSPAIAEIVNGSFRQKEPPAIIGSGFVVRSIEAALWAFHRSRAEGGYRSERGRFIDICEGHRSESGRYI